jgi:aspartokinase/homoserine dehydrogenase 1
MKILKFGGTSVGSSENITRVKEILANQSESFVVVVSAFSGTTNLLESLANSAIVDEHKRVLSEIQERHHAIISELLNSDSTSSILELVDFEFKKLETICTGISALQELSDKTLARVFSFGERISSKIIHSYLLQEGININHIDSSRLIVAEGSPLSAMVDFKTTNQRITDTINPTKSYICGGFIAKSSAGSNVVLGRGGSDLTASIFAQALNASKLEIWSDVNGMLNANPRVVKEASPISSLSYQEAFELAYFGAKVLYPPTIRPVMEKNIPIYLKNTLKPEDEGTFISGKNEDNTDRITGVTSLQDISIVTISGVGLAGKKGTARRVFQVIEGSDVNIILVMQGCSEQSICLGIKTEDSNKAFEALSNHFDFEIDRKLINPIEIENDRSIIAVVGDKMKSQVGLGGKVFSALGENGINVTAITQGSSERNISIVVAKKDEDKAINVIHERFFQKAVKKVHLFIAGVGNVGKQFLEIVKLQHQTLLEQNQLELIIVGIANSRKALVDENGLSWDEIEKLKEIGQDSSASEFVENIVALNLRNTVFIDNTASDQVSEQYAALLSNSLSVVTCNKIAGSSATKNYNHLLELAKTKNCHFQYETSVGAALPIIKTIEDLRLSGDRIHRIQAVLSGSLNFIFNTYNGSSSFADVVAEAKEQGLTEPDPKIDLSGLDVRRKILILAREAGYVKELSDVSFDSFLPDGSMETPNTDSFLQFLSENEPFFLELYSEAEKAGNSLKVIAELNEGNMKVGLEAVSADSPFANIGGKDNIVALYTDRYKDEPLIIKGAGAGAEVTASGVFSDLIYIVNR